MTAVKHSDTILTMPVAEVVNNLVFNKIVAIVLALLPILRLYGWGSVDIGLICTILLFIVFFIVKGSHKSFMPKYLNCYLIYCLVIWIIEAAFVGDSMIPLGWFKMYLIYYTYFACINIPIFVRCYNKVAAICIAFLFLQNIIFYTTGIKVSGIATFLPITLDVDNADAYIEVTKSETWRMCSFFSEPAEFAQYLLPLFAITLFKKDVKRRKLRVVLIVVAFLLLQSGNAFVIMALLLAFYVIYLLIARPSLVKWISAAFVVLAVVVGSGYYFKTESGQKIMVRQDEAIGDVKMKSSGFLRIYRGYYVYEALSIPEKIFGANNKKLMSEAISRTPISFLFGKNDYYYNTFQNIIIKTGAVGAIIFMLLLLALYKRTGITGKAILFTMIVLSFIASFYMSPMMLVYLVIVAKLNDKTFSYQ